MEKIVPPAFRVDAFTCPHCGAYAEQTWQQTVYVEIWIGRCRRCGDLTVWVNDQLTYPEASLAPPPNPDLPGDINKDYAEAASIVGRSPRGAAALLRLCIQKLCIALGESGKNLNDDIGSLVKKGLLPEVQMMLDAVRVIGNNAVHPGEIDLNDTPETAASLFRLVNAIAEQMITHPKQVQELYESLPIDALDAIERRDEQM